MSENGIPKMATQLGLPNQLDYTVEREALLLAVTTLREALAALDGEDCTNLQVGVAYSLYKELGLYLRDAENVQDAA